MITLGYTQLVEILTKFDELQLARLKRDHNLSLEQKLNKMNENRSAIHQFLYLMKTRDIIKIDYRS